MRQMGTVHPAASCGVLGVSYHLSFLLLLLYCSEEALLLLFFGWLRGVQHHGVRASPENKEHRPLSTMSNSKEEGGPRMALLCSVERKKITKLHCYLKFVCMLS